MPEAWDYVSTGGLSYPVKPGQIWTQGTVDEGKTCGQSTVLCGDLEVDSQVLPFIQALADASPPARMAYIDPPWTPSLATGFRTKAGMPKRVDFLSLLRRIVRLAGHALPLKSCLWIEIGHQYCRPLLNILESECWFVRDVFGITYYHREENRAVLYHAQRNEPSCTRFELEGLDDEETVKQAIIGCTAQDDLVIDLCTGRGGTARAAVERGRRFAGIELAPRRVSCTLDSLRSRLGEPRQLL